MNTVHNAHELFRIQKIHFGIYKLFDARTGHYSLCEEEIYG